MIVFFIFFDVFWFCTPTDPDSLNLQEIQKIRFSWSILKQGLDRQQTALVVVSAQPPGQMYGEGLKGRIDSQQL